MLTKLTQMLVIATEVVDVVEDRAKIICILYQQILTYRGISLAILLL